MDATAVTTRNRPAPTDTPAPAAPHWSLRDPATGRYSPRAALWGVFPVTLPTGRTAYRVGPGGRLYGRYEDALAFAAARYRKYARPVNAQRGRAHKGEVGRKFSVTAN